MSIRSTAKAIILHEGKVLLNQCYDEHNGSYYSLPGGGQNPFETLHEAVMRECLEETGYQVRPVRFAALCEEICDNEEFKKTYPQYVHKMLHIFVCELQSEEQTAPTESDDMQTGIEWVEFKRLHDIRLLPTAVGENLRTLIERDTPMFLGSAHIPYNHG